MKNYSFSMHGLNIVSDVDLGIRRGATEDSKILLSVKEADLPTNAGATGRMLANHPGDVYTSGYQISDHDGSVRINLPGFAALQIMGSSRRFEMLVDARRNPDLIPVLVNGIGIATFLSALEEQILHASAVRINDGAIACSAHRRILHLNGCRFRWIEEDKRKCKTPDAKSIETSRIKESSLARKPQ